MTGGPTFFPAGGPSRALLLLVLFAGALGIRLLHIDDPPLDFHPARQYRSALLARAIYFGSGDATSQQDRRIAQAARPDLLEPPLIEFGAAGLYRIARGERLILPRLTSVLFWLGAALILHGIGRRFISPDAALISTAFFLFAPFGIYASRSFQPDPLMVLVFLAAIGAILRYRQGASTRWFVAAVGLSALALFVKPVCIFPLWLAFLWTGATEKGVLPSLRSRATAAYLLLSIAPTLLFYGYGLFLAGFLKDQAGGSFLPHLLLEGFYWKGWLRLATGVAGEGVLVASLIGLPLIRPRLIRSLSAALWGGYGLLGLVFSYHIYTHDYYHLLLLPIAAISLGAGVAAVLRPLATVSGPWRGFVWGALAFALLLNVREARLRLGSPEAESRLSLLREVGELVDHSTETLFLARDYGKPLQYHGMLAGSPWPQRGDYQGAILSGKPLLRGQERLDSLLRTGSPDYFIVTDFQELDRQSDLQAALRRFPVLVSSEEVRIFDLTNPGAGMSVRNSDDGRAGMSALEALAAHVGSWRGSSVLQDPHSGVSQESASTLEVTPVLGGRFVRMDYTWRYGDDPQEGSMLVGRDPKSGEVTAHWIDSWHMGHQGMVCQGSELEESGFSVTGSYPAPPGPDWGWRIELRLEEGRIRLNMVNIWPEGREDPAVEAMYRRG